MAANVTTDFKPVEESITDFIPVAEVTEDFKPVKKYSGPISQFKRIVDIQQEEAYSGMKAMEEMVEKPTGRSVLRGGLGALQYAASPITAVAKGAFREPIESIPRELGAPEIVTQFIGEAAEQAAYVLPYGAAVRQAIKGGETIRKAEEAQKIGSLVAKDLEKTTVKKVSGGKLPLEFPSEPTEKLVAELTAEGKLVKPVIQESIQKEVANAALKTLETLPPDEKKRVGQQIVDLIFKQEIDWDRLYPTLKQYGITSEEFANTFKDTYSTFGRGLQRLSVVQRRLNKIYADNPEAQKFMNDFIKTIPEPTSFEKFWNHFRSLENTRRGLLVTQMATFMRNVETQGARITIGAIDDAFQGAIRATVGGQGQTLKQVGEGLDYATAFLNRFKPSARKRLTDILESENATIATSKLLSAPVNEVVGGKIVSALTKGLTFQEHFFRKIAFEARLTQLLERTGMDIKNIDPSKIPKGMLEDATQNALEITFAAMPKSKMGQKFVREWSNQPLATALLNPFPRFAFGNALPYIINFSPISFLKAMNPKVVAQLATGDPAKFAEHASKATLGTMQLAMAMYLRNSEYRGEKISEVKIGDKYYDTRSYAPLLYPYMLMAEAMSHPEKIKAIDIAQATIGLNRIAGTGLVLTNVLQSNDIESASKFLGQLSGAYLGSFSVPARTYQDIYSGINPEAAKIRDIKEHPVIGPFMRNVPGLSQTLPEAVSPLKSETPRIEFPVLRQLTGLNKRTKTVIEKEVDDLGINFQKIYPRTGIPEGDREMSKFMGPAIEKVAPMILNNPGYKKLDESGKRIVLAKLFAEARLLARKQLAESNPKLSGQIKFQGIQHDLKELLDAMGYKPIK